MKKSIFIITPLLIVGVIVVFVFISKSNKELELRLTDESINVAETVVSLMRGKDTREELKENNDLINEDVLTRFDTFLQELESRNDVTFDLTAYYDTLGLDAIEKDPIAEEAEAEGITDLFEVAEDGGISDIEEEEVEDYVLEDDNNIFSQDGIDYIKVRDLDFTHSDYAIVTYKGKNIEIPLSEVEQTYDMLKQNPKNLYRYSTYKTFEEGKNKYTDVLFNSVTDENLTLIVRVVNNGKQITDFEVR